MKSLSDKIEEILVNVDSSKNIKTELKLLLIETMEKVVKEIEPIIDIDSTNDPEYLRDIFVVFKAEIRERIKKL